MRLVTNHLNIEQTATDRKMTLYQYRMVFTPEVTNPKDKKRIFKQAWNQVPNRPQGDRYIFDGLHLFVPVPFVNAGVHIPRTPFLIGINPDGIHVHANYIFTINGGLELFLQIMNIILHRVMKNGFKLVEIFG